MTNNAARNQVFSAMEAQRHAASYAARPVAQTPAQRATELVARIEVAKMHRNREAFDAAKAELATLIEEL